MNDNRNLVVACRAAATKNPEPLCMLRLTDGSVHEFRITEILDDALLGQRVLNQDKVCLVRLDAVAMIEFS